MTLFRHYSYVLLDCLNKLNMPLYLLPITFTLESNCSQHTHTCTHAHSPASKQHTPALSKQAIIFNSHCKI